MVFVVRVIQLLRLFPGLIALSLALLLLLWGLLLKDMQANEDKEVSNERQQVEKMADLGVQVLQSSVRTADLMLIELREQWREHGSDFVEPLHQLQAENRMGFKFELSLIDAGGQWLFSDLPPETRQETLGELPEFLRLRNDGKDRLLVSLAREGQAQESKRIHFARPLLTDQGDFAGIALLSTSADYLSVLYQAIKLSKNEIITVVHADGTVLMRIMGRGASSGAQIGTEYRGKVLKLIDKRSTNGFDLVSSQLDQLERMTAWRTTADYPLILLVGRSTLLLQHHLLSHRLRYLIGGTILSLLLLMSLYGLLCRENMHARLTRQQEKHLVNLTQIQVELQSSQQELRRLSSRQMAIKEAELKRIAHEIHDELGQRLTVHRIDLAMLHDAVKTDPNRLLPEQIVKLKQNINDILAVVRDIAGQLRPATLDISLAAAAESLILAFRKTQAFPCSFDNRLPADLKLDEARATGIFRILQEALTNAARHASASHIQVTLSVREQHLELCVDDNGCGFKLRLDEGERNFGLSGMRERAIALCGTLDVTSHPGAGTRVMLSVPLFGPIPTASQIPAMLNPTTILQIE